MRKVPDLVTVERLPPPYFLQQKRGIVAPHRERPDAVEEGDGEGQLLEDHPEPHVRLGWLLKYNNKTDFKKMPGRERSSVFTSIGYTTPTVLLPSSNPVGTFL